jgi:hypothetical protein
MAEARNSNIIKIKELDSLSDDSLDSASAPVAGLNESKQARRRQTRKLNRTYLDMIQDEEDDDGEGDRELKPGPEVELSQRIERRNGEGQYGRHVRDARDPLFQQDQEMGMGPGLQAHPLLMDIPVGAEAPIEQINAMENNAAKQELQMKLENKKRMQYSSSPTPAPSR